MKIFKITIKTAIFVATWIAIVIFGILIYYGYDLPKLQELELVIKKPTIELKYSNGNRLLGFGEVYREQVTYYQLPKDLVNAVIATEDRRFFNHWGFDIIGIIRAMFVNQAAGKIVQGGSTITQQLAKMLFLDPERTFKRKVQEVLLALQLEQNFTKEQILSFYLNHAYFGSGNYGVANASKFYFNKEVEKLNLNDSAMLAGLLKAPSKLSPRNNPKLAKERREQVIRNLIDEGYIKKDKLKFVNNEIEYQDDATQNLYFVDLIKDEIAKNFTPQTREKNVSIITTLDEDLQNNFIRIVSQFTKKHQKILENKGKKTELALVAINKEGEVVAMIGGRSYQQSQFNRALQAKRQAGSVFKAIIYASAFENGIDSNEIFEDKKISIGDWEPENYNNQYRGEISLKDAFAYSSNSVAIQLAQKIGNLEIIKMAKKLGITSKINQSDSTIALGTAEVNLLELTNSFSIINNDGNSVDLHFIKEIVENKINGKNKIKSTSTYQYLKPEPQLLLNENVVEELQDVMSGVVEYGTAKNANIDNDSFGKTGTSQNFRDAWFIGSFEDLTIGIWFGNDDNSPTNHITGGTLPAMLFGEIIARI
ncbi:MAG: PBP1A family penicillin-binding protein [Rickettsiales bacterium]|nr:PBP1A family penicillin-binding protein [Rickettsiales bacterium]